MVWFLLFLYQGWLFQQPNSLFIHADQLIFFHPLQFPCHSAAVNGEVISQIHHSEGDLEGRAFSLGGQLHKVAHKLFADASLRKYLNPSAETQSPFRDQIQ